MERTTRKIYSTPSPSSDRKQWNRIFNRLVEMIRSEHGKNKTLVTERDYLFQFIQAQNEQWARRVSLLERRLDQRRKEESKVQKYQAAKANLLLGMKENEALCYKKQSELAENDLEDFHSCIESLNSEILTLKEKQEKLKSTQTDKSTTDPESTKTPNNNNNDLKSEIKRLKSSQKTLILEKEKELSVKEKQISALLAERDFVWDQFKRMESDYIALLKSKTLETDQANEAADKLRKLLEESRISDTNKDREISRLNREIEDLRGVVRERDEMIGRLKDEAAVARADVSSPSGTERKRKRGGASGSQAQPSATGLRRCTRSFQESVGPQTPTLFSAKFKVPKLKDPINV